MSRYTAQRTPATVYKPRPVTEATDHAMRLLVSGDGWDAPAELARIHLSDAGTRELYLAQLRAQALTDARAAFTIN